MVPLIEHVQHAGIIILGNEELVESFVSLFFSLYHDAQLLIAGDSMSEYLLCASAEAEPWEAGTILGSLLVVLSHQGAESSYRGGLFGRQVVVSS